MWIYVTFILVTKLLRRKTLIITEEYERDIRQQFSVKWNKNYLNVTFLNLQILENILSKGF